MRRQIMVRGKVNPQQRPLGAARYFVRQFCRSGAVVLSLFTGTGTDIEAAMTLGHPAIGVDFSSEAVQSLS